MKKIKFILITLLIFNETFSQKKDNISTMSGLWMFEIPKVYESYMINKYNMSISVSFWFESDDNAYTYGNPFTYYGFWDTSYYDGENKPKHISELKPIGRFIFFYDDLIQDLSEENKIGYDSLGNLYRPNRKCDWGFINDGNGIEFNFGPQPDTYKRVDKIPDYVLLSLKKNKEHWKKYLDFIEHKELKIGALKSNIYNLPNIPTKMYLIKNDEVEIVEEKGDWIKIRYYGKKVVEGWIKKSDVE